LNLFHDMDRLSMPANPEPRRPNFSESQLQAMVNLELSLIAAGGNPALVWKYFPRLPSTVQEALLGWDSAFFFPWVPLPPHPHQLGCNFFIQYKLAERIASPRGREYRSWKAPYLRFRIPYDSKDDHGTYFIDYSQFDLVKDISEGGYPTYYVTNPVTDYGNLSALADSQNLRSEAPFFSVGEIPGHHEILSFTRTSTHGLLHSEPKRLASQRADEVLSRVRETSRQRPGDLVPRLSRMVMAARERVRFKELPDLEQELQQLSEVPENLRLLASALVTRQYLRKYWDVQWLTLPVEAGQRQSD